MFGFCIRYSDDKGCIDVTFFAPILKNPSVSDVSFVLSMFRRVHPTWNVIDILPCSVTEFRRIALSYGL